VERLVSNHVSHVGHGARIAGRNQRAFTLIEPFRHGLRLKSNYLYLDLHGDNNAPTQAKDGVEPWDLQVKK